MKKQNTNQSPKIMGTTLDEDVEAGENPAVLFNNKTSPEDNNQTKDIEEKLQDVTQVMEKVVHSLEKQNDSLEKQINETEAIFQGEVKEWGNSAHIPTLKKYIGHMVEVRVLKIAIKKGFEKGKLQERKELLEEINGRLSCLISEFEIAKLNKWNPVQQKTRIKIMTLEELKKKIEGKE